MPKKKGSRSVKSETKRGRPTKLTKENLELVKKLAGMFCTQSEIASILGISEATFYKYPEFKEAYYLGMDTGKVSLRRAQFEVGVNNQNVNMLKWLGIQYLGQSDKQEVNNNGVVEINITDSVIEAEEVKEEIGFEDTAEIGYESDYIKIEDKEKVEIEND
jgi:hypothetical protein